MVIDRIMVPRHLYGVRNMMWRVKINVSDAHGGQVGAIGLLHIICPALRTSRGIGVVVNRCECNLALYNS
jgi:hypothetical protein